MIDASACGATVTSASRTDCRSACISTDMATFFVLTLMHTAQWCLKERVTNASRSNARCARQITSDGISASAVACMVVVCAASRNHPSSARSRAPLPLKRYADPAQHKRTSRAVKKGLKNVDRSGPNNSRFGKHLSEETKEKIRQRIAERGITGSNNPNYRHGHYSK
jgi:hypothetical protein